jgi:adenylate cyclase
MAVALLPTALLAWLLTDPARNQPIVIKVEHFVITSNVSIVAALVAFLVARAALGVGHYRTLLIALGFACMAGIFAVHGLSTPDVLQHSTAAGLVVGVSGQLALAVAAASFATRYTPLAAWLERRVRPRTLVGAVVAGLIGYAALGLGWPDAFSGVARWILVQAGSQPGYDPAGYGYVPASPGDVTGGAGWLPYVLVTVVVMLYGYAAIAQGRDFFRSRLPLQGALGIAYVLLAEAQISQFLGPTWTPSWWEYHGLMLVAVVLAIGALFLELDRRRGLERFLPPTVVERVIQGDPLRLEGERQTVTILFADLRGSTALAERLEPEQVISVMNTYLRVMARSVLDAGGILDKFTGDGLMAIFGAMSDPTQGAAAAARAALDIRRRIAALNTERAARGEAVVGFGVGMHTGDVVLGAIGLPERSDYTAIGDTVNTASRMETLTKEFKVDAVMTADTAGRLRDDGVALRPLGEATVRGKASAVDVFTLG